MKMHRRDTLSRHADLFLAERDTLLCFVLLVMANNATITRAIIPLFLGLLSQLERAKR